MNIVRIIQVWFLEDDVFEGSIPQECYDNAWTEDIEVEGVEEAVALIQRFGLTFAATGAQWAGDPDGSRIIDYRTGQREECSAHLEPGWTDAEIAAIVEAVG